MGTQTLVSRLSTRSQAELQHVERIRVVTPRIRHNPLPEWLYSQNGTQLDAQFSSAAKLACIALTNRCDDLGQELVDLLGSTPDVLPRLKRRF